MDAPALARGYYEAIDAGDDDRLADLLAPEFVHRRPDRTIDGCEAFVRFMREGRPDPDATHEVETVFEGPDGAAVRGVLRRGDGSRWFGFVDAFEAASGEVRSVTTYTD